MNKKTEYSKHDIYTKLKEMESLTTGHVRTPLPGNRAWTLNPQVVTLETEPSQIIQGILKK